MKKKLVYLIGAVLLIGLLIYLWLRFKNSVAVEDVALTDPKVTTDTSGTSAPASTDNFPLKYGSKGARVKQLQTWINKNTNLLQLSETPNTPLKIDGIWGSKTEAAMKYINLQHWSMVNETGFTGANTDSMYPTVSEAFYIQWVVPLEYLKFSFAPLNILEINQAMGIPTLDL